MKKPGQSNELGFSCRDLFKRAGVIGIAAAGSAALLPPPASEAAAPQTEVLHAVEALTAQQFGTLSAITGRIIPTDATSPGALEAHAASYIDKALNSHYSYQKDDYTANLSAVDAYSKATHGANFAELPSRQAGCGPERDGRQHCRKVIWIRSRRQDLLQPCA